MHISARNQCAPCEYLTRRTPLARAYPRPTPPGRPCTVTRRSLVRCTATGHHGRPRSGEQGRPLIPPPARGIEAGGGGSVGCGRLPARVGAHADVAVGGPRVVARRPCLRPLPVQARAEHTARCGLGRYGRHLEQVRRCRGHCSPLWQAHWHRRWSRMRGVLWSTGMSFVCRHQPCISV